MKKFGKFPKNYLKSAGRPLYYATKGGEGGEAEDLAFPQAPLQAREERFSQHRPVMLSEVVRVLQVQPGGLYVDCTVGEGGHLEAIWQGCQPGGRVLGVDADHAAIARARERFAPYQDGVVLVHGNFRDIEQIALSRGFGAARGVLLDLGLNTLQLASGRGFSFLEEAPLDMRYDVRQALTADQVVNGYPERRLVRVLAELGEEPRARRIARAILLHRPIRTSSELAEVVSAAVGSAGGRIHPATKVFQAVRMEVNGELPSLERALQQAIRILQPGGRLAVISFNSLEDRLVKRTFVAGAKGCVCPPKLPVCVCGQQPIVRLVGPKLWRPSPEEVQHNPRSRSARMRVAERLPER